MPKFKLKWSETVIQYWEKVVTADSQEEAEQLYHDGEHIDGDEYIAEESFLESELDGAEEISEKEAKTIKLYESPRMMKE